MAQKRRCCPARLNGAKTIGGEWRQSEICRLQRKMSSRSCYLPFAINKSCIYSTFDFWRIPFRAKAGRGGGFFLQRRKNEMEAAATSFSSFFARKCAKKGKGGEKEAENRSCFLPSFLQSSLYVNVDGRKRKGETSAQK